MPLKAVRESHTNPCVSEVLWLVRDELEGDFNLRLNHDVGIAQDCKGSFTSN